MKRWNRHGRHQSPLIWLLALGAVAIGGACSKRTSTPPEAVVPPEIKIPERKIERAGRLQTGVEWRANAIVGNAVQSLDAVIGARSVEIPRGAFAGLPVWDESLVIQFAESGADIFLILADGRGPSGWLAKFLIRENWIVERELTVFGRDSVTVHYANRSNDVSKSFPVKPPEPVIILTDESVTTTKP